MIALLLACSLTFHAPVRYASPADEALLVADFDGDGAPDLLTSGNQVDQQGAFSLLPNRGDGTFGSAREVPGNFGEKLEDVADLNGDGVPDLLVSNYWQNGIAVYRGTGAAMAYATSTHGGPSRIVDFDGDGLRDVVSFSFGSGNPVRVHLFRGRGDGTFDAKTTVDTTLAVAATPSTRVRNGAVEVLAAEHSGRLGLFRIENGSVSVSTLDAGPGFDLTSRFADLDGDGVADVIDANDSGAVFVTLARSGERKPIAQLTFPTELQAGDLDGDGLTDLVVGDFRATSVYFFRGHGTGTFDEGVAIAAGGPVNEVAIVDLNGDHRPDLVTVNDDHTVSVILNGGRCPPPRRRAVRH